MIDQAITLCGNLTKDVEFFAGTVPRAKFRIAHNSRWLDTSTGEWKDNATLFMDVVCWRSMAHNVTETIGRGDPVVVVGRLRASSWVDAEKGPQTKQEIEADVVAIDLRRGVTGRFRKMARNATESSAFQSEPLGSATGEPAGEPGAHGAGEPGFGEPGFGQPGFGATSAPERELVGAGTEPPF